jgi:CheY-like chemotaxis protein
MLREARRLPLIANLARTAHNDFDQFTEDYWGSSHHENLAFPGSYHGSPTVEGVTMQPRNSCDPRALIVDDDPSTAEFVAAVLKSRGWDVQHARTGDEALAEAHRFSPNVVFLDVMIPQQSGWLVCAKLKLVRHSPSIVFMTGLSGRTVSQQAEFLGADGLLHKPFAAKDLLQVLEQLRLAVHPATSAMP